MQAALLGGINEMENRKTTTANNVYEIIATLTSAQSKVSIYKKIVSSHKKNEENHFYATKS